MKYISLFSGIGGFEQAIHKVFPNAECVGYSEIKPHALKVYQHHYPTHKNLGDITKVTNRQIRDLVRKNGCDLVVGGFPCTNLTKLAILSPYVSSDGIKGPKSSLFYDLLRILRVVSSINTNMNFIIENNASMTKKNQGLITNTIKNMYGKKIFMTKLDNANFGVQTRKRLFWTNFYIEQPDNKCKQVWKDVLEPVSNVKNLFLTSTYIRYLNSTIKTSRPYKYLLKVKQVRKDIWTFVIEPQNDHKQTRFQMGFISDTTKNHKNTPHSYPLGKSRPILGTCVYLIDRRRLRSGYFRIRKLSMKECERLFGFPDNYTLDLSTTKKRNLLGNSVCVSTIKYVLNGLM